MLIGVVVAGALVAWATISALVAFGVGRAIAIAIAYDQLSDKSTGGDVGDSLCRANALERREVNRTVQAMSLATRLSTRNEHS